MSLSQERIEIRFQEVKQIAQELRKEAVCMKKRLEKQRELLLAGRCYKGKSAEMLRRKEVELCTELEEEINRLLGLADKLMQQAEKMYLAEQRNYQISITRIYR